MTKSFTEEDIEKITVFELNAQGPPEDFEWGTHLQEEDHTRFYYAVNDVKARFTHWQCDDCGDDVWTVKSEMPDGWDSFWSNGIEYCLCEDCYHDAKLEQEDQEKNERLKKLIQDGIKWDD